MAGDDASALAAQLETATMELSFRGLANAAQWAAEQARALRESSGSTLDDDMVELATPRMPACEVNGLLLARAYMSANEYRRAASMLKTHKSALARFLRGYALFLHGEQRKEEELAELAGDKPARGGGQVVNAHVETLSRELGASYTAGALAGDGFLLYLYGLVLREMQREEDALRVLCESVNTYPLNWSAWLDLCGLCTSKERAQRLQLQPHFMQRLFVAKVYVELHQNQEAITALAELDANVFRGCSEFVTVHQALAQYNNREFDEAQVLFESVLRRDPFRLDSLDVYSNILYVKGERARLSHVAHSAVEVGKYRPETCCIIGNYYSLKGKHEKAVVYFQRALKLDRHYLSAWTLMGHEYAQMKNANAAVEAYRMAVDINARDYRAWYSLGQMYEMLELYDFALFYYRRAITLRPFDPRMWTAMGSCYEKLAMLEEALRCYLRAETNKDNEQIALHQLADIHEKLGDRDAAADLHRKNLERWEREEGDSDHIVHALHYLSFYHKRRGELKLAEKYAAQLLDYDGAEKEDAKALLREMQSAVSRRRTQG